MNETACKICGAQVCHPAAIKMHAQGYEVHINAEAFSLLRALCVTHAGKAISFASNRRGYSEDITQDGVIEYTARMLERMAKHLEKGHKHIFCEVATGLDKSYRCSNFAVGMVDGLHACELHIGARKRNPDRGPYPKLGCVKEPTKAILYARALLET